MHVPCSALNGFSVSARRLRRKKINQQKTKPHFGMDLKSSRCEILALYDLHSAVLTLHLNRRAGFPRPHRLQLLPVRRPERLTGHPHENSFGKHVSPVIHLDWRGLGVFSLGSCAAASCSSGAGDQGQDSPVPCPPCRPQGYGAKERQAVLNLNLQRNFGSL